MLKSTQQEINTLPIYDYLHTRNISKSEFCKTCKISQTSLANILNPDATVSIKTLFKVAVAMGISTF